MCLEPLCTVPLNQPLGQLRAAPLSTGPGDEPAVIIAYAADYDIDPYHEMFFFPTDTVKLAAVATRGENPVAAGPRPRRRAVWEVTAEPRVAARARSAVEPKQLRVVVPLPREQVCDDPRGDQAERDAVAAVAEGEEAAGELGRLADVR
jgi:hypothetical protein